MTSIRDEEDLEQGLCGVIALIAMFSIVGLIAILVLVGFVVSLFL